MRFALVPTAKGFRSMVNASRVRDLSKDQPYEAEDVLSLMYPAPLRMNREKAENLRRYFMDPLRSKENSFCSSRETEVMARMLLLIIKYVNHQKFPGLDESQWPLTPLFIRALCSTVSQVSEMEGCSFLKKSFAWKGAKWYFNTLAKLLEENQKNGNDLPPECKQAGRDIASTCRLGFHIWIFFTI